jgi:hypothetical protein
LYSSHPSSVQRYIYTILIFHIKERNWMCMLFMKYWFAWILFRGVYEEKNFRIYKFFFFFQTDIFGIMAVSHQTENKYYLIWTVKREKKNLESFSCEHYSSHIHNQNVVFFFWWNYYCFLAFKVLIWLWAIWKRSFMHWKCQ